MERKTQRIRSSRLRLYFSMIFVVFGLWNTWLIVKAFYQPVDFKAGDQIRIPEYVVQAPQRVPAGPGVRVEKGKLWERYMDSLKGTEAGKAMVDSLERARPGLLDSIGDLEKRFDPSY